jgi:hypothetical protein
LVFVIVPVKEPRLKPRPLGSPLTGSIDQPERREKVNKRIINHSFSRRPKR